MDEVKLLENIFTCEEKDLPKYLKEKSNWINQSFYIGGYESDLNSEVYDSLMNGFLIFKNGDFNDEHFTSEECAHLNELTEGFGFMDLADNMNYDCDFFIEYDFRKMENSAYHDLYPNFYHKIPYEKLDIKKENIDTSIVDIFKSLIIGIEDESRIIVWKNKLDNLRYYAPIINKIYYRHDISNESLIKLSQLAHKNHVEIGELYGN